MSENASWRDGARSRASCHEQSMTEAVAPARHEAKSQTKSNQR
jgi:hypothetical protein